MKILILVLHSKLGIYNELIKIQQDYLNKICSINKNIKWYKYYFDNNVKNNYINEDTNSIIIKGNESHNPGCRIKTYEAFKIIKNMEFDYLVRINEATIVNYKLLEHILTKYSFDYGGAINTIQPRQIDLNAGLFDYRYAGIKYVSGRCIIIKKNIILNILKYLKYNKIDNVIDDLSIGIIISKFTKNWLELKNLFREGNKDNLSRGLVYSHKSINRYDDLNFMKKTIKFIFTN